MVTSQIMDQPVALLFSKIPLPRSLLTFYLIFICLTNCAQITNAQETDAVKYLLKYGYLPKLVETSLDPATVNSEVLSTAVSEFQRFFGINVTGRLDHNTLTKMAQPRCGFPDKSPDEDSSAVMSAASNSLSSQQRKVKKVSKWESKNLTYSIITYPSNPQREDVDSQVRKAFDIWANYTDLTFTRTDAQANIKMQFVVGAHGCKEKFDGPGKVLAHAFTPASGGTVHFDASEPFTVDTAEGTNFLAVATHEIGHSLGLPHSESRDAIMFPIIQDYAPNFDLKDADIQGIQALYGKKSTPNTAEIPEASKSTIDLLELCFYSAIDALIYSGNDTIVFKGDKYWRLINDENTAPGYPKPISNTWKELPGKVDAAFTAHGRTYFFKGDQYWRYEGTNLDKNYPRLISSGFPGIPDDIDAAYVWSGNGNVHFFKGNQFWRYSDISKPTFPEPIGNWGGLPVDSIDAAFQHKDGYTYVMKNYKYWRFNEYSFSAESIIPAFPGSNACWWYGGCFEICGGNGTESPTESTTISQSSAFPGDSCTLENKQQGVCRLLSECSSAIQLLTFKQKWPPLCAIREDGASVICCDESPKMTSSTTRSALIPTVPALTRTATTPRSKTNRISRTRAPFVVATTSIPFVFEIPQRRAAVTEIVRTTPRTILRALMRDSPGGISLKKCAEYSNWQESESFNLLGGTPAEPFEFPHMVHLGYQAAGDDLEWDCGGSLISDQYIMTAAHCVRNKNGVVINVARLGTSRNPEHASISGITIHPFYSTKLFYYDIALLKLNRSISFTSDIRPACIQVNRHLSEKDAIASGWGATEQMVHSEKLLKVSLPIMETEKCRTVHELQSSSVLPRGIDDATQLCAGGNHLRKDTCKGDSGGPLQIQISENPKVFSIVGVTSFGARNCGTAPGVYTRVSAFVPWIESVVWPKSVIFQVKPRASAGE